MINQVIYLHTPPEDREIIRGSVLSIQSTGGVIKHKIKDKTIFIFSKPPVVLMREGLIVGERIEDVDTVIKETEGKGREVSDEYLRVRKE